jgi:molybdopterin converting factor small subunit
VPIFDIPVEWERAAGGLREVHVGGSTVREALDELVAVCPGLSARLAIGRHGLFVNWLTVRLTGGQDTPVSKSDVIVVLPYRG